MEFNKKIALLMILAAIHFPCAGHAAEEDKELSMLAAEQKKSDEKLDEINPALTETISTERTQETDKEKRNRKKKLERERREKEKSNEQKLKDSVAQKNKKRNNTPIVIDQSQPQVQSQPQPKPQPAQIVEFDLTAPEEPKPQPQPQVQPQVQPISKVVETAAQPAQKQIYNNFSEIARAVNFVPLYMPKKSGYEITALYAQQGFAEIRYGRKWEPTVSLTVRTHKRAPGEQIQDISGVTGVKWRIDTTSGITIYIAKISDTQQVAAWAVGQYTFSAQAENLSYAGFHSLVADELVELSTHYYLDL